MFLSIAGVWMFLSIALQVFWCSSALHCKLLDVPRSIKTFLLFPFRHYPHSSSNPSTTTCMSAWSHFGILLCTCIAHIYVLYNTTCILYIDSHATHATSVREARLCQNGWIFGKFSKGGGVISDPKNFVAKFLAIETPIWGGLFPSKNFRRKKSQLFWTLDVGRSIYNFLNIE